MTLQENTLFGYNLYLNTREALITELKDRISFGQTSTIISLNTLKLYQGSRNKELEKLFQSGTHTIPDGQSIAIAEFLVYEWRQVCFLPNNGFSFFNILSNPCYTP